MGLPDLVTATPSINYIYNAVTWDESSHIYVFDCNVIGTKLIWQSNDKDLYNFRNNQVGAVNTTTLLDCNVITSLISSVYQNSQYSMTSVMIVSCPNSTNLTVHCSNGTDLDTVNTEGSHQFTRGQFKVDGNNTLSIRSLPLGHILQDGTNQTTTILIGITRGKSMNWKIKGIAPQTHGISEQDTIGKHIPPDTLQIGTLNYLIIKMAPIKNFPLVSVAIINSVEGFNASLNFINASLNSTVDILVPMWTPMMGETSTGTELTIKTTHSTIASGKSTSKFVLAIIFRLQQGFILMNYIVCFHAAATTNSSNKISARADIATIITTTVINTFLSNHILRVLHI